MKELELIKTLVKQAGSIIMKYYGTKLEALLKENNTYLTKADTEANNFIITKIKQQYPEDGILSEETIDDVTRLNKKRVWIIDPLDGTHHFMRNQTEFSCAICLIENNRPILAATYKPINDELYFAVKGKGAFLEQKGNISRLHVSNNKDQLKVTASKATGKRIVKSFIEDNPFKSFEFRGSSCYKFCLVATGEYDAYVRDALNVHEWDVCGGDLIVHEAGGKVTDINNKLILYNQKNPSNIQGIIATNKVCHELFLDVVNQRKNVETMK